ncbi:hypothetical protein K438DRAFT_1954892 [Mycena galopus ATCC 62051]|nr:hypothetical protein K438DRAFT_2003086 [Mycena galopus ATCC 62051]KAF8214883.1 hypothetical protein K438DRAFT_1954892 [Mycena galopus ATCC 62051]
MVDEERFLVYHEGRLVAEGERALAHQVAVHRMERGRFNGLQMEQLVKLSKEPGFTGCISPGVSVNKERQVPEARTADVEGDVQMLDAQTLATATPSTSHANAATTAPPPPPSPDEAHDADDEDVDGEAVADAYELIVRMAHDAPAAAS